MRNKQQSGTIISFQKMYGLWGYLLKAKALPPINARRVLEGWYLKVLELQSEGPVCLWGFLCIRGAGGRSNKITVYLLSRIASSCRWYEGVLHLGSHVPCGTISVVSIHLMKSGAVVLIKEIFPLQHTFYVTTTYANQEADKIR